MRIFAASAGAPRRDEPALSMATHTLRRMCLGGIYDHLGGGFCRYSVDEQWMIPHFEKMLYDNGPLLALCAQGWQATGEGLFRKVATETGEWAMREMQSPEGGYYSSLDADSEGEEGKFYVWEPEEVRGLLREEDYPVFAARFGLDRPPNFEGRHWHLHVFVELEELARRFDSSVPEIERVLDRARSALLPVRSARVWPGRDDKVLTSWNALMIKGMAVAGGILSEPRFIQSAARALDFLRESLWRDGRLRATYKDGRARFAKPTSTTTPFSSMRFWPCSRRSGGAIISTSPSISQRFSSLTSKTRRAAASSSPPTITRCSSTAPSPSPTTPCPPATASPPMRSGVWGT